jgi:hypothetical protein
MTTMQSEYVRMRSSKPLITFLVAISLLFYSFSTDMLLPMSLSGDSTTSRASSPPPLPLSFQGSGVVIFYHIPKTGGTTIRENFVHAGHNITVRRVMHRQQMETAAKNIEEILHGRMQKIWIMELHGTVPGLPVLHEQMQKWRELATQNQVPFFAFTLLREPVSFSVSYFSHFRAPKCRFAWCERDLYNLTEENLVLSTVPNQQCQILMRGQIENKKRIPSLPDVSEKECREELVSYLQMDWDWVGTTEDLQRETLPILSELLLHNATVAETMRVFNLHKKGGLSPERLDTRTIAALQSNSRLDMELYETYRRGNGQLR